VEKTIAENYGVAMPVLLEQLTSNCPTAEEILKIRDQFVREVNPEGNPWEARYAEKFGFVLAAALLLVRYKISPWTEKRAREAILTVYKASRSVTVSAEQATDSFLIDLREAMKNHRRFPRLARGEKIPSGGKGLWGVVRAVGGKKGVAAVIPFRARKLVKPSAAYDLVLKELAVRNLLVKAPGGNLTRQVLVKGLGERARYICIRMGKKS
jgi:hypothetical protein